MIRKFFIFIVAMLVMQGCAKDDNVNSQVYQAVFNQYSKENKTYFVREAVVEIKTEYLGKEELAYWESYKPVSNEVSHSTHDLVMSNVELVSDVNFEEMFSEGCTKGWNRFHYNYPNAEVLISLSKVGYRNEGKEAVVYIEVSSACLAARGNVVFLEKSEDGAWKVIHEAQLWNS